MTYYAIVVVHRECEKGLYTIIVHNDGNLWAEKRVEIPSQKCYNIKINRKLAHCYYIIDNKNENINNR